MTCCICRDPIPDEVLSECPREHFSQRSVCAKCTVKLKAGNQDTLDKLYDARTVTG